MEKMEKVKGALNKFLTSMKKPVLKYYLHINGYLHLVEANKEKTENKFA